MNLKRIHLRNFKKHEDLLVEFSQTLTVIMGANWAGKSSLLHAIFFALFGATAVPGGKNKIVRRGAKNCEVLLEFDDYELTRTLTTATLKKAGSLVATGHTAVNEYIETKVMHLDQKRAIELSYSPQSETAALLTLGAPKLNRMIEELTDADYVERLIVACGEKVKAAQARLDTLGPAVDLSEAQTQHAAATADVADADAQLLHINEYLQALLAEYPKQVRLYREADEANKKVAKRRALEESLEMTVAKIEQMTAALASLDNPDMADLKERADRARHLAEELRGLQQKAEGLKQQEDELNRWFDTTGAKWQEDEQFVEEHEKIQKEYNEKLDKTNLLQNSVNQMNAEFGRLQVEVSKSECGSCHRPFDEAAAKKSKDKLKLAEKNLMDVKTKFNESKSEMVNLKLKLDTVAKKLPPAGYETIYNSKVADLERAQAAWQALGTLPSPEQVAQAATADREAAAALLAAAGASQKHRSTAEALARLERERQDTLAAIELLPSVRADVEAIEKELSRIMTETTEWTESKGEWLEARAQAAGVLASASAAIVQANARADKGRELEKRTTRFGALQKWLRDSKTRFLAETWESIMLPAGEFVGMATMGYATAVGRSDDGDFSVTEDGVDGPMVTASGGMRSICGVALRLGLASILPQGTGFLVLDEPSSELNNEHAAALAGALRAQGRQVILVTHREGEEYVSDTVVRL